MARRRSVNLVGRSVDCIKTPDHQDEILRSRVEATRVLGEAMRAIDTATASLGANEHGAYRGRSADVLICDEDSPPGYGLAPFVAQAWEEAYRHERVTFTAASHSANQFRHRPRSRLRRRSALTRLGWLTRLGLGGTIGSGTQGFSWIHETDLNRLFERAITDQSMQGIYIASSPNPVPQKQFMAELRRTLHIPFGLPAFAWMVRLGAPLLLKTDPDLALYGRYVVSKRLAKEGFDFRFPNLPPAVA